MIMMKIDKLHEKGLIITLFKLFTDIFTQNSMIKSLSSTGASYSLWASSYSWNARDGDDSQVLGVTLGVKLIFVFSVTFGIKGLWGWFVLIEVFE